MKLGPQREDARHREATGVANAEPPVGHFQGLRNPGGATDELDPRSVSRRAVDHNIGERDAGTETSPNRFEHCLLGGETSRQSLDTIGAVTDFVQLALREAARNQRIAWVFDPTPQLSHLNEVDSMSDYIHACQRAPNNTVRQHNLLTL